ncbi:MAG: acyl-CoA desaturase [Verrucomicrobiota bacterium JB023]|nr:acyl-CoA desaturase [Verrucomicrobiota bacterium JB023]
MPPKSLNFVASPENRFKKRMANLYLIGVPAAGSIFWLFNMKKFPLTWIEVSCFLTFYVLTGLSIGLGFHRCFSHQSYRPIRPLKLAMLFFGSLACQGSIVRWVADHRRHHRLTDKEWDTHSPCYVEDRKFSSLVKGLVHAHFTWMFDRTTTDHQTYAKDILKDPDIRFFNKFYYPITLLTFLLPAAFGYLLGGSEHLISCLLIGGALRTTVFHNVTWSVNSIGHAFGSRDATENDDSRNNLFLALLTFGEGWHNNHHASPRCAINQWKWYQIDMGGWLLLGMERIGLVSKIHRKHL